MGFFNGLSAHWRGWEGIKSYESLERDLQMGARHDGQVRLNVEIFQMSGSREWGLNCELALDPGDELTGAAEEVESYFTPRN